MTIHQIHTMEDLIDQPLEQKLKAKDVRVLLERYDTLTIEGRSRVEEILLGFEHDRWVCKTQGINYAELTVEEENFAYQGIPVLRALATKEYLVVSNKSTSQLSRPQLKLPVVYRQVPE